MTLFSVHRFLKGRCGALTGNTALSSTNVRRDTSGAHSFSGKPRRKDVGFWLLSRERRDDVRLDAAVLNLDEHKELSRQELGPRHVLQLLSAGAAAKLQLLQYQHSTE